MHPQLHVILLQSSGSPSSRPTFSIAMLHRGHFLIQSSHHCYLPHDVFYTADPTGATAGGASGEELLTHWLGRLPLRPGSGAQVTTRCHGKNLSKPEWVGFEYCDAKMAGKVFVAPAHLPA